ncbi:MAG: tRNA (guanosine(46)-N7)-methyltransferase TrmB [Burkholderiales bacterium]
MNAPVRRAAPLYSPVNDRATRPIRSFVLRQGRISNAQQRAIETLLPHWGIPFRPEAIDLNTVFGREAPKILEIGFGMGETTAAFAAAHPEIDLLGVEVHTPGVGSLLKQVAELGITNLRVIQHDAVEVVRHMIPPASLRGVHVFFPDPWPKKRHHKRRLLQPPFVSKLVDRLQPGGYIHVATDWQDYAEQVLEVLRAEPLLENTVQAFAPRPAHRPMTRFEQRGLRLGHGVWDIVFLRPSL